MSFRCEKCQSPQPVGSGPYRVTTKTREKQYRRSDNQKSGNETTFGFEIAEELNLCEICAGKVLPPAPTPTEEVVQVENTEG